MSQERKKDMLITAAMFLSMVAVIVFFVIIPRMNGRDADIAETEKQMFDLVDAAVEQQQVDSPTVIDRSSGNDSTDDPTLMAANEEVRGAPLGAEENSEVRGAPLGESGEADSDDPTAGMEPIRTIPQESWDMLEKLEGGSKNPEELYKFSKTKDGKYLKVNFSALGSYEYEIPDPDELREAVNKVEILKNQIPDELIELNGADVVIVGFMVPIEVTREGQVKSFALTQNQAFCCFGVPPGMNEWIMVEMEEGHTAEFTLDLPVAAFGKIAVGEEIEDGYVMSVYRMTAGEVIDAQELIRRTQQG